MRCASMMTRRRVKDETHPSGGMACVSADLVEPRTRGLYLLAAGGRGLLLLQQCPDFTPAFLISLWKLALFIPASRAA